MIHSLFFKLLKWVVIGIVIMVVWSTVTGTMQSIYWWMYPDGQP
jgi:hypothetical protein